MIAYFAPARTPPCNPPAHPPTCRLQPYLLCTAILCIVQVPCLRSFLFYPSCVTQNDIEERLDTKPQPDQAAKADDGATAAAAASDSATTANDAAAAPSSPSGPDLERRVAALEEQLTAQQAASASQPPRDVSTSPPAGTREATEDGPQAAAAPGLDLGSQLQELVAGHSALAATVAGLQKELEAKPSRGELDLKANRSELDAMLRAGAAPVAAEGEAAAPALAVAEDGSVDSGALADAVNKAGAELAALRGQVAVLMERLGGKVRRREKGGQGQV